MVGKLASRPTSIVYFQQRSHLTPAARSTLTASSPSAARSTSTCDTMSRGIAVAKHDGLREAGNRVAIPPGRIVENAKVYPRAQECRVAVHRAPVVGLRPVVLVGGA